MAAENRRVDSIRIRLSDDMMTRFEALSARFGMPPATLGAFAVARFVTTEENNMVLARGALSQVAAQLGSVDDSVLEKAFAAILLEMLKQGVIPADALQRIDDGAPTGA